MEIKKLYPALVFFFVRCKNSSFILDYRLNNVHTQFMKLRTKNLSLKYYTIHTIPYSRHAIEVWM